MAHGAVTIINATATGRGCSLGVTGGVEATWEWGKPYAFTGASDDKLARACLQVAQEQLGRDDEAAIATTASKPASRGLKTSSSAAAAMLESAGLTDLEAAAVDASRRAGVTLTGAFDDQVAVVRGGCHLTNNAALEVLDKVEVRHDHVAIWIPERAIAKSQLANIDANAICHDIEQAEQLLLTGDVAGAMTANGVAFTALYAAHGLPVTDEPARVALDAGADGAGLSGTGPAVAALFEKRVDLPSVAGGKWVWEVTV